jgi:hypothetical protein
LLAHPGALKHPNGTKGVDFVLLDGRWVELKCDSRAASETPNAFIETWACVERHVPGGPWQAYGKGADVFVYRFACGKEIWLDCAFLINRIELNQNDGGGRWEKRIVKNSRWSSEGLLIPWEWLQEMALSKSETTPTVDSSTTPPVTETTPASSSAKPGDE